MTWRSTSVYSPIPSCLLVLAVLLAMAVGCGEDVSIRTYRVAKDDSRGSVTPVTRTQSSAAAKDQLMLAAIVPNESSVWFFKLTGQPEVVRETSTTFRDIVQSVVFDSTGQPSWTLPAGWIEQITPNDITYGKLLHSESGLTATVTRLPFTDNSTAESWRGYVVSNVNRWRNQLSLSQQSWDEMSNELEELSELSQGASTAYLISLEGKGAASPGMGPFMGASGGSAAGSNSASTATSAQAAMPPATTGANTTGSTTQQPGNATALQNQKKPIDYKVPDGWTETAASGMRMAAFSVPQGEESGEVTVIAAGGQIDANIGIWLGQVGVEANEENKQSVLQAAQEVAVNGVEAKLYTIDGTSPSSADEKQEAADQEDTAEKKDTDAPETDTAEQQRGSGPSSAESIVIADIPWRAGQSLFVKFKGPSSMAAAQREKLIDFVKSIQWQE